ncbi:MAG: MFS transporter [Pseudomonadota bacterium]
MPVTPRQHATKGGSALQTAWQRVDGVIRPQGYVFRGWWLVAAAAGIQFFASVLFANSYSAYMVLLQDEFGWSKTVLAGAFAMTRVESGLLGPLQGWLADRFGPRIVLIVGNLLFGLGLMLFSLMNSILTLYLTFALMAIGSSLGGFPTLMVALVNWFDQHRSKAVAGSQLGYAIGGLAVPLLVVALTEFGWRATAFVSGLIVLAVCVPVSALVRHRPAEIGEVPDGKRPDIAQDAPGAAGSRRDLTAREAMRTSGFWLLSLGHACALLTVSAVMVHLIPHLNEGLNFTLLQAASVVTLITACQIIGQALGGYLGDRYDKRIICVVCMVGHSAALLLLAHAGAFDGWWPVTVAGIVHGLAWGARGPLMVAMRADFFGTAAFGTIMGFSSLIVMFGMSGGPIIGGVMADIYGNYELAFTVLAAATLSGALCFAFARPPRARRVA